MNEAIGAKGGHRDRLKTKQIKKNKKKKQEALKELEKEVKKQQKNT